MEYLIIREKVINLAIWLERSGARSFEEAKTAALDYLLTDDTSALKIVHTKIGEERAYKDAVKQLNDLRIELEQQQNG